MISILKTHTIVKMSVLWIFTFTKLYRKPILWTLEESGLTANSYVTRYTTFSKSMLSILTKIDNSCLKKPANFLCHEFAILG